MVKDCCKDETNLKLEERTSDKIIMRCQVCGSRHIRVKVELGSLIAKRKQ